jgi:hypothetical protein
MPRLTPDEAMALPSGRTLYHHIEKNRDGSPLRARINGKVKVWRRPHNPQWQRPMKYGIKTCFYLNPTTCEDWFTREDEARLFHRGIMIVPFGSSWDVTVGGRRAPAARCADFEAAISWAIAYTEACAHV